MNSENKESAPNFFLDENESLVDYASFESCYEIRDYNADEALLTATSTTQDDTLLAPFLRHVDNEQLGFTNVCCFFFI